MRAYIVLIAIALVLAPGCGGCGAPDATEGAEGAEASASAESTREVKAVVPRRIPITAVLSRDQDRVASGLAASLTTQYFPRQAYSVENAPLYVELAARNEEPNVVAACLHALDNIYVSTLTKLTEGKKLLIDDDYRLLVLAHLGSDDDQVLDEAIKASNRLIIGSPEERDEKVALKLAELAVSPRPDVRFAALSVLRNVRTWTQVPALVVPFMEALDASEDYVLARALGYIGPHAVNLDPDLLWPKVMAHTKHDDPGVRGQAVELLVQVAAADNERKKELGVRALAMLDDDHPFVRSKAAQAVGRIDYVEAIPRLLAMVDDNTENRYAIEGWTQLDGTAGRAQHDGSAWSRVSDAALAGLADISHSDPSLKFMYNRPVPQDVEGGLGRAAEDARAWYAENKADLTP